MVDRVRLAAGIAAAVVGLALAVYVHLVTRGSRRR